MNQWRGLKESSAVWGLSPLPSEACQLSTADGEKWISNFEWLRWGPIDCFSNSRALWLCVRIFCSAVRFLEKNEMKQARRLRSQGGGRCRLRVACGCHRGAKGSEGGGRVSVGVFYLGDIRQARRLRSQGKGCGDRDILELLDEGALPSCTPLGIAIPRPGDKKRGGELNLYS